MWLFTSKAFVSVVADKDKPNGPVILVRARVAGAIEELFPKAKVFSKKNSDYIYRAWILRQDVVNAVSVYINRLNYDNFKNSIGDDEYHHACSGVWQEMYNYQYDAQHPRISLKPTDNSHTGFDPYVHRGVVYDKVPAKGLFKKRN